MTPSNPATARYVMIGGFLGAGKSTAVIALAGMIHQRGLNVGLITNDQSVGLVDTALMASQGFDVQEIAGGCFCCRFDSLVEAAAKLSRQQTPDIFIAEPVGSCTDLVATVSYPLRRIYGDRFTIAPLSVMVDPVRAERVLGLERGKSFSEKVIYVYRKQLEEADLIVINKADTLDASRIERLRQALAGEFPDSRVLVVSARRGEGMHDWLEQITHGAAGRRLSMALDYDAYAEGEALLGWLNATARLEADDAFDGEVVMMDIAQQIHQDVSRGGEIAHLKMTMIPDDHGGHLAALNVVRNDFVPELWQSLAEKMRRGRLIINLRAEADPQELESAVRGAIETQVHKHARLSVRLEHLERFRPARPTPKWRMTDPQVLARHQSPA